MDTFVIFVLAIIGMMVGAMLLSNFFIFIKTLIYRNVVVIPTEKFARGVDLHSNEELRGWLKEHTHCWIVNPVKVRFRRTTDAVVFTLRWL